MDREKWMPEYIEKLEDETISFFDVTKYIQQYMPDKLYSYKKINAYWKDAVFKGCVHMSYASDFNDPFDCLPTIDFSKDSGAIATAYREYSKSMEPRCRKAKKDIDNVVKDSLEKIQKNSLITCFTETYESMLMWSYYTDNHKGICIEYDTKKDDAFKLMTLPVVYKEKRYNAIRELTTQNKNIIMNSHLYKDACWEHEHEWRILCSEDKKEFPGNNIYMKQAISGVYLGARIESDIEEEISNWGKEENIPIYKMYLDDITYKLNKTQV